MPKSGKIKWRRFEKKINRFFKICQFDYVDGGPSFKIANRQIDAIAVYTDYKKDNNFLIVEATSKQDPDFKDIREKIKDFNDIKTDIESEIYRNGKLYLHKRDKDGDYSTVEEIEINSVSNLNFILALEDIDYDDKAFEMASKYKITIWGSKYVNLNNKLANIIGSFTKYTILRELSDKIDLRFSDGDEDDYCYSSFRIDLSGEARGYMYLFPITPEKLLKLAYVYRRELSQPENLNKKTFKTYQRMLNERKIKDIGENFLSGKDGFFRNNIIIVFEKEPKIENIRFTPNVDGSACLVNIFIPKKYASIKILDGHHRLYGFLKAKEKFHMKKKNLIAVGIMPVANEEAETFLSINTKQTPVNTDVLWDLYSLTEPDDIKANASNTIKELNFDYGHNAFFSKVYIPSNPKGNISSKYPLGLGNLCKTLSDLNILSNPDDLKVKKSTLWKNNNSETIKNASQNIRRFYSFLESVLDKEWFDIFFMSNNGFNVSMRVFNELLQFIKSSEIQLSDLDKTSTKEGILDFVADNLGNIKKLLKSTSNEGGRLDAAKQIIFNIWTHNSKFANKYLSERMGYFDPDIKNLLGEILDDLRIIVDKTLSDENDWWNKFVPTPTKEYANQHKRTLDKTILKEESLYFITEGHLIEIISRLYNKYFDRNLRKQFEDRKDFDNRTALFKDKRDENLHFLPIDLKPSEIKALYSFHSKLHSIRELIVKEL